MIKKCKICGEEFTTKYQAKEYCSESCRREACNERQGKTRKANEKKERGSYARKYDAKKAAEESSRRIRELERAAAAAGMSYGKYVSKYGL